MYAVGIAASGVCMLVIPIALMVLCLLHTQLSDLSIWQAAVSSAGIVWMLLFGAWFFSVTSCNLRRSLTSISCHGECRRLLQSAAHTLPTYSALHLETKPSVSFTDCAWQLQVRNVVRPCTGGSRLPMQLGANPPIPSPPSPPVPFPFPLLPLPPPSP